jgi:hydrogenase nickel incorporation protein HypA/HybF
VGDKLLVIDCGKFIMQRFIDIILQKANHKKRVLSVHLVIGELIDFSPEIFQRLTRGTSMEDAKLQIRIAPAELQCMACFGKYHPIGKRISCPICGSVGAKILSGEEFIVESIEMKND